jgi:two-component system, cell cycle response regulator
METPPAQFKILVADDSPLYRKLVEKALAAEYFKVFVARDGAEAIDLFSEQHPHLVVTDWMMPDISGIELCKCIRRDFPTSYTYIIILTAMTDMDKIVSGLAAGADDYLTKPFHAEELMARVGVGRRVVELHRQIEDQNRLLEELALTDVLTGLPNRRAVEAWAERELHGASRHGFPFWVAMADLDRFKSINDAHGHDAGDAVLKKFAEILKSNTRQCNMCARIGGEEFILILTHAEKASVQVAIERIRQGLQRHEFRFKDTSLSVTASFGIASFEEGRTAPHFPVLMSLADEALYAAKRKGRNRVEFSA